MNDQKAKVAELKDSIRNYELKMDDFSSNLDNTSKKLDKAQIDYISILGIFSSIVLAFTGGITFSSSVLDNISNANIYFLIIITSLIGIVFATIIFMLFNAIHIISGKYNVKYAFIKSLTPLIIIIALFIGVIVLTYCGWRGGIVEGRDNRVSKQYKSNVTKIIETTEATETTNTLESSQVDIMTETADTE